MGGYLLDTNILTYWFHKGRPEHQVVTARISGLPEDTFLAFSAITMGEIEYGHRVISKEDTPEQSAYIDFIENQPLEIFPVKKSTCLYYGRLRAKLFEKYAPRKGRKALRPEQLVDPVTSEMLGIQENDLWIAAQALEYNLTLVTHDRLDRLRQIAPDLMAEDWAATNPSTSAQSTTRDSADSERPA